MITAIRIALLGLAVRLVPPSMTIGVIRQWMAEEKGNDRSQAP